jgi:hypothetical protein
MSVFHGHREQYVSTKEVVLRFPSISGMRLYLWNIKECEERVAFGGDSMELDEEESPAKG